MYQSKDYNKITNLIKNELFTVNNESCKHVTIIDEWEQEFPFLECPKHLVSPTELHLTIKKHVWVKISKKIMAKSMVKLFN